MAFLHKLWDETVAGPIPDDGLSKLRKFNSFSASRSTATGALAVQVVPSNDDSRLVPVSRSISVVGSNAANNRNLTVAVDSPLSVPSSPAGSSTTPTSPFSPSGNFKKLARRKSTSAAFQGSGSKEYDWIMLSALDR